MVHIEHWNRPIHSQLRKYVFSCSCTVVRVCLTGISVTDEVFMGILVALLLGSPSTLSSSFPLSSPHSPIWLRDTIGKTPTS